MKRKIESRLISWKNSADRKPLILNGARQVGKTYILREFGRRFYKNTVYINLERNTAVRGYFDDDISASRLIKYLEGEVGEKILPGETLVILDEIQSCERAITSLKYFCEDAPEYHIAAAGSLLGVAINRSSYSYPVGKVNTIQLFPMDFEEFLWAGNADYICEEIKTAYESLAPVPETLHKRAMEMYKDYLIVGGMPEAVKSFYESNSYIDAGLVQSEIINNYTADMVKYATNTEAVKIRACYNSITNQLAKDNKKFLYKVVQRGGSAAMFGPSLDWLKQAGVILECNRIEHGMEPLSVYSDPSAFKIYMSDVGLLFNKSGMSIQTVLSDEPNLFMGAVTENYVAQQLASKGYPLYYWATSNSQAELDFVVQKENNIFGIEVKRGEHVRSRSLGMFAQKYKAVKMLRVSSKNFGNSNGIISIPLYAVFML